MSKHTSAYHYLPASVADFPGPEELCLMLERTGFREAAFQRLTFGISSLVWARAA